MPVEIKTGIYKFGKWSVPQVSASVARTKDGAVIVALTNLDPHQPADVSAVIGGGLSKVAGEILTADAIDAHNTFDHPDAIHPVAFDGASLSGGALRAKLPPKSVVVLTLQ